MLTTDTVEDMLKSFRKRIMGSVALISEVINMYK